MTLTFQLGALVRRIITAVARNLLALSTRRYPNRIILLQESLSGSNSYALHKLTSSDIRIKYELILHQYRNYPITRWVSFVREQRLLASSRLIVSTHGSPKRSPGQCQLQLWHGSPLKAVGHAERTADKRKTQDLWPSVDLAISNGAVDTSVMSACFLTHPHKFLTTGAPRNDFLVRANGRENIERVCGAVVKGKRLVFFMPTFREGYYGRAQGDKNYSNPFGFARFDAALFDATLGRLDCLLLVKPHPHDENVVLKYLSEQGSKNVLILKENDLNTHRCDVYELLNASSALITDYSSVCFDYLLLDRPMIFCPVDFDAYRNDRGFVREPYERWTPGPKVLSQGALAVALQRCIEDPAWFASDRAFVRDLIHHHQDADASARVWEVIDDVMTRREPRWRHGQ